MSEEKEWQDCPLCKCPACGGLCQYHENDRGDFEHRCKECGKIWRIDKPDYCEESSINHGESSE